MATNILMPALSPTMTEGTVSRWLKKEGDKVRSGDLIAEIETDKATMEVEAVDEGILGRIVVPEGTEGVKVNSPIAILVEEGEALPELSDTPPAKQLRPHRRRPASRSPQKLRPLCSLRRQHSRPGLRTHHRQESDFSSLLSRVVSPRRRGSIWRL